MFSPAWNREQIIDFSVGFGRLIVFTATQCNICSLPDVQSPVIVDLKSPPSFAVMSATNFALVSKSSGIRVYSYDGRFLSSPRFQGLRADKLNKDCISVSPDSVAIIDQTDDRVSFSIIYMIFLSVFALTDVE